MVVIVATSACFPVCSQTPNPGAKAAKFGGRTAAYFGGIMSEPASGRWQDKANAQAPFKINDSAVSLTKVKRVKNENDMFSSDPMTFIINQLSDWSILLATFTTMFLKPRRLYMVTDPFGLGIVIQDNVVSRQNFPIRSYEIGADRTASIDTLMNLLQETAVNQSFQEYRALW